MKVIASCSYLKNMTILSSICQHTYLNWYTSFTSWLSGLSRYLYRSLKKVSLPITTVVTKTHMMAYDKQLRDFTTDVRQGSNSLVWGGGMRRWFLIVI